MSTRIPPSLPNRVRTPSSGAGPAPDVPARGAPNETPGDAFEAHSPSVSLSRDAHVTPAARGGQRVADAVMQAIGSYDRSFLLDTDGLKAHVRQVATRFIQEADGATAKGSVYQQLQDQFPGAHIALVGTGSLQQGDQVYFLVRSTGGQVRKFEDVDGKPVEAPDASGLIFMAAELGEGKRMKVRIPEVRFLINPTLPPSYGVGRTVDVVMDTPVDAQKRNAGDALEQQMDGIYKEVLPGTQKGEDGTPLGVILQAQREEKGTILKYNGDKTYDVQVAQPGGTKKVVTLSEDQIRQQNDPMVFNLHGSTYDDVSIDVDQDPKLQAFLDQAKAIAEKDIPKGGTPSQRASGQRQALVDLTILCNKTLSYPDEDKNTTDPGSLKFNALANAHSDWNPMKLGDLIDAGRGVCRHQAIIMQLACQVAGISSRTVAASANDRQGNFRGYHAFLETTLDDGSQYLTDPTWFDAGPTNVQGYADASPLLPDGTVERGTPLWDTLYYNAERQVLPSWNNDAGKEDHAAIGFEEDNAPVVDAQGNVVTPAPAPVDTRALLDKMRVALSGEDYQQMWPGFDPKSVSAGDYLRWGDQYAQKNDDLSAAWYYSLGIEYGASPTSDQTKALWGHLSQSLSRASSRPDVSDRPGLADLAQKISTLAAGM